MEIEQHSDRQTFVYDLIYPAFLGAMLFEIVPLKSSLNYFIGLVIVIYYLFDYCHLYFYLRKRIPPEQRNTVRYVLFDFLVSFSLFFSFRYVEENIYITIWIFTCVSLWFLIYSTKIKYRTWFYWAYFIFGVICAITWTFFLPENSKSISAIIYIIIMALLYGIFILSTPKLSVNNGS